MERVENNHCCVYYELNNHVTSNGNDSENGNVNFT